MQFKVPLQTALALAALGAVAATALAGPRGDAGDCGVYKYWQDGHCTDAREKGSGKSWADEMLAKHWKP
jgi:hypothetical protein